MKLRDLRHENASDGEVKGMALSLFLAVKTQPMGWEQRERKRVYFPCRVLSNRFWWTRQKEWEMSERTSLFVSFPFTSSRSILTSLVSHSPPVSIFSLSGDGMAMSSVLTDFYLRTWIREVIEWTVRPRAGTSLSLLSISFLSYPYPLPCLTHSLPQPAIYGKLWT